jgi:hypothetical protein
VAVLSINVPLSSGDVVKATRVGLLFYCEFGFQRVTIRRLIPTRTNQVQIDSGRRPPALPRTTALLQRTDNLE